jgi:hypothetical protein
VHDPSASESWGFYFALATDRIERRDLQAGSDQEYHDNDEKGDKEEFEDFPRILAGKEGSYAVK